MSRALTLTHKHAVDLYPSAPFDFDTTMHKPDHFPSPDNAWQPGARWQTMLWQRERLGLVFQNCGTIEQPRVLLSIWSKEEWDQRFLDELVAEVVYRCNFRLDLTDFIRRFRNDSQLGPVIRKWRGMRPACYSSLYEYVIIAIVLQNCTVRRSVNMMQAMFENYGTLLSFDGKDFYCFWSPEEIHQATEQELRSLKTGYRARAIKRVTEAFVQREINELELRGKSRDEQRQALLGLYGIGPASVDYILSDVFHHLDEMSHISPWEQRIYSKLFCHRNPEKPVSASTLLRLFHKRFGGYEMLAVHYVWEDLFWKRSYERIEWLEKLIRL